MQDQQHEMLSGLGEIQAGLEDLLVAARPRLRRLALAQRVEPDAVEDVIQETWIEAWRHCEQLQSADVFDAWLNGICRNVCLRWWRRASRELQHPLFLGQEQEFGEWDLEDPYLPDPEEDLIRQDLEVLLDRAMGYLPPEPRQLLELRYLKELSNSEIAARLKLKYNVLDVRLFRARRLLKQVLLGDLREEASSFGLAVDQGMAPGWRQSRIWCFLCGQQLLDGIFETHSNGQANLRMRCKSCSPIQDQDIITLGTLGSVGRTRSFLPAFKRLLAIVSERSAQVLAQEAFACPDCGALAHFKGTGLVNCGFPYRDRYCLFVECSSCGPYVFSSVFSALLAHPEAQKFIARHPRWLNQPEDMVTYNGLNVIRVRLFDVLGSARLSLFVHPEKVSVLGTLLE